MPSGLIGKTLKKALATACSLALVLQSSVALAADVTSYTYDQVRSGASNIGQLTTLSNGAGTIEKDYDANGNVTRQSWQVGGQTYTQEFTYAPHGQLLRQKFSDNDVVPSASQVIQYNGHGELNAIPGLISGITRAATGEPLVTSYANGVTETRTYHAQRQWLFAIVTANSSETLFTETYVRDNKGLIKEVTSNRPHGNWTYGYDGVDRLTTITNSTADYNQTLAYNAADNITSNSVFVNNSNYTYPAPTEPRPHAVIEAGGNAYTYDANGNLLTGGGRTIQYDGENRPTQITALGQTTTFTYGPDGARLTKTTGGQKTIYLGADEEITPAGERIKHPAPGVRKAGSSINWLQRDHLSSVRLMSNASGAIIAENHFRPYGARTDLQVAAGVPRESKGWIGERDDPETGLTYLNARYYDPVLARFISPDWFEPQEFGVGTNRYAYGLNNPVAFKDPSGNLVETAGAAAAASTAGSGGLLGAIGGFFSGLGTAAIAGVGVVAGLFVAGSTTPVGDATITGNGGTIAGGLASDSIFGDTGSVLSNETNEEVEKKDTKKDVERKPSRRPTKAVREAVDKAQTNNKGKVECGYCGQELTDEYGHPNSKEYDHVKAYSKGGSAEIDNITASCRSCNRSKGAKDVEDWLGGQ
ncbi:RHS repeat-associated core domain-containing protein [Labrenzia sp. PHM005]|uniref:RHS repeat-associated core domain-containing protein n=1 Tax=Labrenzia sp. PHM005 TaxID=2590016 RepID=UPI00143DBC36|nr:RHS repeat-associated core domain-containing protein [Labrenzia sp. PHM005]